MEKRMFCVLGLSMILFFGASITLWADSGVCPVFSGENMTILDLPEEEVLTAGENLAKGRSQVLLELFGRTT
jgi:hypothetical protein